MRELSQVSPPASILARAVLVFPRKPRPVTSRSIISQLAHALGVGHCPLGYFPDGRPIVLAVLGTGTKVPLFIQPFNHSLVHLIGFALVAFAGAGALLA